MRMDRAGDVLGFAAVLNGQGRLRNQLARVYADDGRAHQAAGFRIDRDEDRLEFAGPARLVLFPDAEERRR